MIYFQILEVASLSRRSLDVEVATGVNLSDSEAVVLLAIKDSLSIVQADIVGATHLDKMTVSRVCERLRDLKLVRRQRHPTDQRMRILFLTSEGDALAEKLQRALHAWEASLLREYEGCMQDELTKMAYRLKRIVEAGSYRGETFVRRNNGYNKSRVPA